MEIHESVGVTGIITPWNFLLRTLTRKIGLLLVAVCTAVAKLSNITPLTALVLSILAYRSGYPLGVLEVIRVVVCVCVFVFVCVFVCVCV